MSHFVLEIGVEELPARFLASLERELHDRFSALFADHGLTFDELTVDTTPRRAVLHARNLLSSTPVREEVALGPSLKAAYDAEGNPTKAAMGFARGQGVDVADLKGQITKLQGQLTDQADSFAFDAALDGAIRDARGRDVKAIRGMLDVAALKASKDRTSDIKTALDALVKGKAWAFDAAPGGYPNVKDGGEAAARGKGGMVDGVEAAFASMNPNLKV